MNRPDLERWKSEVLDQIFVALAGQHDLEDALVFKGARVLNILLNGGRQSLDIDANLTVDFVRQHPDREEQRLFLERSLTTVLRRFFNNQQPVRYELMGLRVINHPPRGHPMGWDAFDIKINVNDLGRQVRALPALTIDVASPEELLPTSVSRLWVAGRNIQAYALERIAGEKLRAFLSSLPTYRAKVKKPGEAVRTKDLYDIANIRRQRELSNHPFWLLAGQEFRLACKSRYIDCAGLTSFQEHWEVTRKTYFESSIPKEIPFDEAEAALVAVVAFFVANQIVPFEFPLPQR